MVRNWSEADWLTEAAHERVAKAWSARRARMADPQNNYPSQRDYLTLSEAEREARRVSGQDIVAAIGRWRSRTVMGASLPFLDDLERKLRVSGYRYALTPIEWERFWSMRDALEPIVLARNSECSTR